MTVKKTSSPKVSVLTPIYNTNHMHLREMIESILNQTYTDFEFLILNDSPDNTELDKIVKSYKDKRIKYYKNSKNIGISASRNKLLKLAQGEYIAVFDHDDISVPERLAKEVDVLNKNPLIGVVSSWIELFGEKKEIWKTPETNTAIQNELTDRCCVWHTASMIRKSVLISNNINYEEYYSPCEDYQLWSRLMDVTFFYNIQEALVKYRWFKEQTSHVCKSTMILIGDSIRQRIKNNHIANYAEYIHTNGIHKTMFYIRLFGFLPILKIKNNSVLLFGFIPLCKIKWK